MGLGLVYAVFGLKTTAWSGPPGMKGGVRLGCVHPLKDPRGRSEHSGL